MIKAAGLFPRKIDTVNFLPHIDLSKGLYLYRYLFNYQPSARLVYDVMVLHIIIRNSNNDVIRRARCVTICSQIYSIALNRIIFVTLMQFVVYPDVLSPFGARSLIRA